jgi:hypothetical protein
LLANIREDQLGVTLGTGQTFMHAAQRVAGLIVIELRNGTYRLPSVGGVAVLARDGQRSVRAGDSLAGRLLRVRTCREQEQPCRQLEEVSNEHSDIRDPKILAQVSRTGTHR